MGQCILDNEGVAYCCRKHTACKWWSWTFVIDYAAVVVLFVVTLVVNKCWAPYLMYEPTVNITTALVDSEGVHNVEQTVHIKEQMLYPVVKQALPAAVFFGVIAGCCIAVFVFAQVCVLPFSLLSHHPNNAPCLRLTLVRMCCLLQCGTSGTCCTTCTTACWAWPSRARCS